MQKTFITLILALCGAYSFAQSTIIRTPSLSPDGQKLAFSYQGDIWVYDFQNKQSKRLTIHQAYESNPVWSHDGAELVFSSNRKAYVDLFKLPVDGGRPSQLTFYPSTDLASDWTKDGQIYFTTSRIGKGVERENELYSIAGKGGTPQKELSTFGHGFVQSPNENLVAIEKGYCRISREDYEGPAQRDIYVYNRKQDRYIQITTSMKNDHSPRFDAEGNLYFISARSGRYNIYKQALDNDGNPVGDAQALTGFKSNGVIEYSVAKSGDLFYNAGFEYYTSASGKESKMNFDLPSDYRFETETFLSKTSGMSDFQVSPNGKMIAYEVDGEIFVKENDKEQKFSNNVSQSDARDQSPVWISDSELVFVSDRTGQNELHRVKSSDDRVDLTRSLALEVRKLTSSKSDVTNPKVAPNRKRIAYQVGRGGLILADVDNGKLSNLITFNDSWAAAEGLSWSPDSKYIAYSQEDLDFDSEIFIQSATNPAVKVNVSMHPRSDNSPVWSPDGKKLAFISNRSGNRNGIDYDVWMVFLQKSDWEKTKEDLDLGSYYNANDGSDKKEDKEEVSVKIDFDRIYDRSVQVTSLPDQEYSPFFASDSEHIYFTATNPTDARRNVYKIKWNGEDGKQVKGMNSLRAAQMVKTDLYAISRGGLKKVSKSDKIESLPFKADYSIDYEKRYAQVFDEGVRALTDGFYDPNFHGYDWKNLVKTYRPWALSASTKQDYTFAYNLMLGQLNASHMGYRGSNPEKTNSDKMGLIGVGVHNSAQGFVVDYILPGSAADKKAVGLNVGNTIAKINGQKIKSSDNFYSYFRNSINRELLLELSDGKEVIVRAESSSKERNLQYDVWVKEQEALVDRYSGGRLGYIHIRGMNLPSFEAFERAMKAAGYGKEGLVIDVRFNGGGWTTDRLMAVLDYEQHAYTIPRGAVESLEKQNKDFKKNYPYNERAILSVNTKPVVALCNEFSYSNAEIFSHAFKSLGLGKLVGQPTFGAVISTGGHSLMDGFVRMPFRAWYVKDSGMNMELGPAVPDYVVKNDLDSRAKGEDAQLKKAVEVLLSEL